jgi:DNA-binding CsgD family transcriptional regulator
VTSIDTEYMSVLIGDIYQAAYDQERWPDIVETLRSTFKGSKACIARIGPDLQPSDAIAANTDPTFQTRYMIEFADEPNVLADAVMTAPLGAVYHDHTLVGPQVLRRTRFWNEWMAPQDMYDGLGCKILMSGPSAWILDLQRGRRQPEFDHSDMKMFEFIVPHIRRSVQIGRQFQARQALASAFSHLPFGLILVDGHQQILTMNGAAEAILTRSGSALRQVSGRLTATDLRSAATLERFITDASSARNGLAPGPGGDFLITTRPHGHQTVTLSISVGPFIHNAAEFTLPFEACAVVAVRELTFDLPAGFTELIRDLFELTPKEAELAAALVAGHSLREAAENANIRFSTARSHLERIFQKTGVRQQSQLVALLKSAQPILRRS